ncbi:MAG: hypothetical protein JSW03_01860 [Candidatus Eiseniibacteriota bacterium]|nr:MAG: hypothetical protein JSW03_01860 [Candidatus Eisenbacteria bacterium]
MEKIQRFTDFSVKVDPGELRRYLGYGRKKTPASELDGLMKEMSAEAEDLARPAAIFSVFGAEEIPRETFLFSLCAEGERARRGETKATKAPAREADAGAPEGHSPTRTTPHIALSICTIGLALEERVSEYSNAGELAKALVLDSAGSTLAEAACDFANERICAMAAEQSLHAAPRTSPGYGRWKVEEQETIFRLLPADSVGVSLTKSYMMVPRKSVSFAVRLSKEEPSGESVSPCRRCGRKNCEFRR